MSFDLAAFADVPRVTDGAWGTEFQRRGLPAGSPPDFWNDASPDTVEAVARSYVEAGSEIILTNTFGCNRFVLEHHGAADRAAELAEKGAALSRKAAGDAVKVFGSMGPSGKIVMMEDTAPERLAASFAELAEALQWGGVDGIVLETFNELDEIRIALRAVREAVDLPVVASMTFSSGPQKTATMMGNQPADLARLAAGQGAAAVGANCGVGPDNYIAVAKMLREATDLPIWIKANAGLPQRGPDGKNVWPMDEATFAGFVPSLVEAGATFIGGCCGTSPATIAAVRAAVDELRD